jgi:adenine-specific DNA-methyltransferase
MQQNFFEIDKKLIFISSNDNKQKNLGQVFTPKWIVDLMLDKCGLDNDNILEKTILEPSCGDGAFLCQIVKRIVEKEASKFAEYIKTVGKEIQADINRLIPNKLNIF